MRGSNTSTEIPSSSASAAASSASWTSRPVATTVTSPPSRWIRALPNSRRLDLVGNLALDGVQETVLEEQHRVVVVDRAVEQVARVDRQRGEHDLEAGHMHEPGFELLGMLRAGRPARAALRANRQRHLQLAAGHVAVLRRLVHDLLHRERREVLVHDLDDRAHALHRGADAGADDRHLGDRRVADALGPNSWSMPCVTPMEPPISAMSSPMMKTSGSRAHRLDHRVAHGLAVRQLRHWRSSPGVVDGHGPAHDTLRRWRQDARARRRPTAAMSSRLALAPSGERKRHHA